MGTHSLEVPLMVLLRNTHNVCFHGKKRREILLNLDIYVFLEKSEKLEYFKYLSAYSSYLEPCILDLWVHSHRCLFSTVPAESRYALPLLTVLIQISWLLKKPTDQDLHCLSLSVNLFQQPGLHNLVG